MTTFCKQVCDDIVGEVRGGAFFRSAAALVGIHHCTLYEWIKRGEAALAAEKPSDADLPYAAFVRDLRIAEAFAEKDALKKAREDSKGEQWYLARRFNHWSDRGRLELSGPDGGPIDHKHTGAVVFVPQRLPIESDAEGEQ